MSLQECKQITLNLFRDIQRAFPHLQMTLQTDYPHVDVNMDIPHQVGLQFDINLNLQGDEIHLSAGHFWCEWFPCDQPGKAQDYYDAVCGLISGEYRIVEFYRFGRVFKAQLQRPVLDKWQTIASWGNLWFLIPGHSTTKILQNLYNA